MQARSAIRPSVWIVGLACAWGASAAPAQASPWSAELVPSGRPTAGLGLQPGKVQVSVGCGASLLPCSSDEALLAAQAHPRGLRWSLGPSAVAFATLVIAAAIIGLLFYQSSNRNDRDSQQVAQQKQPTPAPTGSAEQSKQQQQPQATPEPAREQQPAPGKGNTDETPRRQPAPKKIVREPKPGEQFASAPAPIRSGDAQTMTAIHFEKSETLLVAFRNVRLNGPGSAKEVDHERQRAKQLVLQNMMLRREADAAGDVQTSSLLESLEPILIDIANLPDRPDDNAVRVIRQRVERKNIVPLLRVNSTVLARALD